jgi:Ca2+/Na+ antiporter
MSKRQTIMILAAMVIAVALFSGFPPMWNTVLYVVLAFFIIVTAYLMKPVHSPIKPSSPYIEHTPVPTLTSARTDPVTPPSVPITSFSDPISSAETPPLP